MSETETEPEAAPETTQEESVDALRLRAAELERQLHDIRAQHEQRVLRAELKAEAVRAGMVDLDGLKLVDTADLRLDDKGEVEGATLLMSRLKRSKPWLFGTPSSSSSAAPPPSAPPRRKLATEMTDEEWRQARADILKRR
jgi:hypothetical protein